MKILILGNKKSVSVQKISKNILSDILLKDDIEMHYIEKSNFNKIAHIEDDVKFILLFQHDLDFVIKNNPDFDFINHYISLRRNCKFRGFILIVSRITLATWEGLISEDNHKCGYLRDPFSIIVQLDKSGNVSISKTDRENLDKFYIKILTLGPLKYKVQTLLEANLTDALYKIESNSFEIDSKIIPKFHADFILISYSNHSETIWKFIKSIKPSNSDCIIFVATTLSRNEWESNVLKINPDLRKSCIPINPKGQIIYQSDKAEIDKYLKANQSLFMDDVLYEKLIFMFTDIGKVRDLMHNFERKDNTENKWNEFIERLKMYIPANKMTSIKGGSFKFVSYPGRHLNALILKYKNDILKLFDSKNVGNQVNNSCVLYVEDNKEDCEIMESFFHKYCIEYVISHSVDNALELLKSKIISFTKPVFDANNSNLILKQTQRNPNEINVIITDWVFEANSKWDLLQGEHLIKSEYTAHCGIIILTQHALSLKKAYPFKKNIKWFVKNEQNEEILLQAIQSSSSRSYIELIKRPIWQFGDSTRAYVPYWELYAFHKSDLQEYKRNEEEINETSKLLIKNYLNNHFNYFGKGGVGRPKKCKSDDIEVAYNNFKNILINRRTILALLVKEEITVDHLNEKIGPNYSTNYFRQYLFLAPMGDYTNPYSEESDVDLLDEEIKFLRMY